MALVTAGPQSDLAEQRGARAGAGASPSKSAFDPTGLLAAIVDRL